VIQTRTEERKNNPPRRAKDSSISVLALPPTGTRPVWPDPTACSPGLYARPNRSPFGVAGLETLNSDAIAMNLLALRCVELARAELRRVRPLGGRMRPTGIPQSAARSLALSASLLEAGRHTGVLRLGPRRSGSDPRAGPKSQRGYNNFGARPDRDHARRFVAEGRSPWGRLRMPHADISGTTLVPGGDTTVAQQPCLTRH